MPSIFQYKFLLPPAVAILLLHWADRDILDRLVASGNVATELLLSILLLFAVGFLISTVTYASVTTWIIRWIVKGKGEIHFWKRIASQKSTFLEQQITKRWDLIATNVNNCYTIILVVFMIACQDTSPSYIWWLTTGVLFTASLVNIYIGVVTMRTLVTSGEI